MKYLIIIILFLYTVDTSGQQLRFSEITTELLEQLEKMGVDDQITLNSFESRYLNFVYANYRSDFDFTNKKVGFIHAGGKEDKKDYFELERRRYRFKDKETPSIGILYIFNEEQKIESGGYDSAIVYSSKSIPTIEGVVNKLKKQKSVPVKAQASDGSKLR